MGQNRPTIITTTHRASEISRSFAKVLKRIIPDSILVSRGSKTLTELTDIALNHKATKLIILHSRGNRLSKLNVYRVTHKGLIQNEIALKFYQLIDPKIFGWKKIPGPGPLSISRESRIEYKEIIDFFDDTFHLQLTGKAKIWLMIDRIGGRTYIQFLDALTMKKFLFAEVKLVNEVDDN